MRISVVICAVCALAPFEALCPSYAQTGQPVPQPAQTTPQQYFRDDGKAITPEQKAKSDQLMANGLSSLQSAGAALQAGNEAAALSYLRSAYSTMESAEPIYHGYREKSLKNTHDAGIELDRNRRGALQRASAHLTQAISDAQTAVASW